MIALVLVVIALLAVGFTVEPLLRRDEEPLVLEPTGGGELKRLQQRREVLYEGIRDLDFELAMGRLTKADHAPLREQLVTDAVAVVAELDELVDDAELDRFIEDEVAATAAGPASTCPSCRRRNPAGARFCDGCGAELSAAACRSCHALLRADARFCGRCGAKR